MKSTFFEYYNPSEDEIKSIWDDCYLSLDANVLLNLYRYTEATKNDFFKVLENNRDKLILTYQACNEYHKNRLTAINSQLKSYDELANFINSKYVEIENELNKYKKHSYINPNTLKQKFNKTFSNAKNDITKLKDKHPDLFKNDPVREFLTELFDKKVTIPYETKKLEEIFKEGKVRYEKEIPPGYKDLITKKGKEESSLYGDLIIWFQLIDFVTEKAKPIIFVTDDLKEDWWYKFNGETKGPRIELLKEFHAKTKQKILIYNPDSFLRFVKDKMGADIEESSIEEIIDVRSKDINLFDLYMGEHLGNILQNYKLSKEATSKAQQTYELINEINSKHSKDIYYPNNNLTDEDLKYFFDTYFNVDEERKNIIDSKFKTFEFIDENTNFDALAPQTKLEIRRFAHWYKSLGSLSNNIIKHLDVKQL